MRPPEFTGGKALLGRGGGENPPAASMRPPEFTGGKTVARPGGWCKGFGGFNEAAGIHRRKGSQQPSSESYRQKASMRPPEFTGGKC